MTPKEKAEELVIAKQSTLNAVNVILRLGKKLPLETLEYYLEVKKEIEKI